MGALRRVTGFILAMAAAGGAHAQGADARLRAELERVAQQRIFFGHQSVGENVLDGLRRLAAGAGVQIRVADKLIGENRHPLGKLEDFERSLQAQPAVQIALMKFCYLDIDERTDVKALFASYRATLERLKAQHPRTTFVHVTAPLTRVQGGAKGFVKRLLGRAPYGALENQRREEYNALLRQAYGGREPLFDIARIESTAPDGKAATAEWQGRAVPRLADALTDDGHHLNDAGRLRAARELVAVLAAVPAR
jgi:hypothetical protein